MTVPVTDRQRAGGHSARPQRLYSRLARLVSLLAAGALSLVLTFYPQAVMQGGQAPEHAALMLCMWGIAAGFVHIVLGPLAAWVLMLGGTLLLVGG
jgi:hypothetical protein